MEVLNEPEFRYKEANWIETPLLKFRVSGFKSGDKLNLRHSMDKVELGKDFITLDNPRVNERYLALFQSDLDIIENNTGLVIGKSLPGGIIEFNSNVDKFESVDVQLNDIKHFVGPI